MKRICEFELQYLGSWYYVYNPFLKEGMFEFLTYRFKLGSKP